MFSTLNFCLCCFSWFVQFYFFLCLIFHICLRPKHMCPGSCPLKEPHCDYLFCSKGGLYRTKGIWTSMAHICLLIHFPSTQNYGISFPNDLKSIFKACADFTLSPSCGICIFQTVFASLDPSGWQGVAACRGLDRDWTWGLERSLYMCAAPVGAEQSHE